MTEAEWESLCDGCGRCCLIRFEDEETGEVVPTHAACRLFDDETCRCKRYQDRREWVPDCVELRADILARLWWMPKSCAYRRLHEGLTLPNWHPLVSGRSDSVVQAGASVRGRTFSENLLATPEDALFFAEPSLSDEVPDLLDRELCAATPGVAQVRSGAT